MFFEHDDQKAYEFFMLFDHHAQKPYENLWFLNTMIENPMKSYGPEGSIYFPPTVFLVLFTGPWYLY